MTDTEIKPATLYTVRVTDTEEPTAWMSHPSIIALQIACLADDSGQAVWTVTTSDPDALEAAMVDDDAVIEFDAKAPVCTIVGPVSAEPAAEGRWIAVTARCRVALDVAVDSVLYRAVETDTLWCASASLGGELTRFGDSIDMWADPALAGVAARAGIRLLREHVIDLGNEILGEAKYDPTSVVVA